MFYLQVIFNFSLSCCVCVFALLHSSIACHEFFGINLRERKKLKSIMTRDREEEEHVAVVRSSHQSPSLGVLIGAVHNDSTVSVVDFGGQAKRWWVSLGE